MGTVLARLASCPALAVRARLDTVHARLAWGHHAYSKRRVAACVNHTPAPQHFLENLTFDMIFKKSCENSNFGNHTPTPQLSNLTSNFETHKNFGDKFELIYTQLGAHASY